MNQKILVPKINFSIGNKEIELFIGMNIKINNKGEIFYKGGFVKEREGTSKTTKAKKQKKKEDTEQGEKLESKKGGEVTI